MNVTGRRVKIKILERGRIVDPKKAPPQNPWRGFLFGIVGSGAPTKRGKHGAQIELGKRPPDGEL